MPIPGQVVAIIDDDPAMLKGIERLLQASGYTPEAFSSAEAFLERAPLTEATCLVLDIHLGGISGIELRRRLNATGSKLPVIFITAVDDAATHQKASEAGCVAYLLKPFRARELIKAIQQSSELAAPI